MTDLWQRLRDRKLAQWALAYAAAMFALLQGVDMFAQRFGWPDSIQRGLLIASVVGFFVVLLLAWYHGERGAQKVSGTELLILALVLAVGGGLLWRFTPGPAAPGASGAAPAKAAPGRSDVHSVAVLPFLNMSGDKENEYFSDGISEQILNELAQMEGLKVAARTSSFSFKGRNEEVPAIAHELEVRMVLEGSVRKQGDRVRITAQLIDAATGYHVWSQVYDRELKDIFAIQDEIARAIALQLEVKLGVAQTTGTGVADTADLEAYQMYLKASQLWAARGHDNMQQARELFRSAVARDPRFAKAWAGLALAETLAPDWLGEPNAEALPRSRDAAERALALDPLLPEAYAALGNTAATEGRMETAYTLFDRAIHIAPSYATAWQWYGYNLGMSSRIEEGIDKGKRAIELDPKSFIVRYDYLNTLYNGGADYEDEVIAECGKILALRPDWLNCKLSVLSIELARKDYAHAGPLLIEMAAKRGPKARALAEAMVEALEGKRDPKPVAAELFPLTDGMVDLDSQTPLDDANAGFWYMAVGMPDKAVARLDRVAAVRPGVARYSIADPRYDALRCREDFRAMVAKTGYVDLRAAEVCAGVEPGGAR